MAAQAGLCLAWSEISEDTFCRVVAHIYMCVGINYKKLSYPSWRACLKLLDTNAKTSSAL